MEISVQAIRNTKFIRRKIEFIRPSFIRLEITILVTAVSMVRIDVFHALFFALLAVLTISEACSVIITTPVHFVLG